MPNLRPRDIPKKPRTGKRPDWHDLKSHGSGMYYPPSKGRHEIHDFESHGSGMQPLEPTNQPVFPSRDIRRRKKD